MRIVVLISICWTVLGHRRGIQFKHGCKRDLQQHSLAESQKTKCGAQKTQALSGVLLSARNPAVRHPGFGLSSTLRKFQKPNVRSARRLWNSHMTASATAVQEASSVSQTIRPDLAAAIGTEPPFGNADEEALLAKSAFPIPPDQLIGLAKAFTAAQILGTVDGSGGNSDWFASDFRFVAPVVGPLDKSEFIDSLKSFDLQAAFPDNSLSSNYHHWRVDPFEPNRVWYSIKYIGVNSGPLLGRPATNKYIESPVQAHSLTFNEKGEVTKFTIGYVLDKETGNTGGLGGVFGLFYACGYALPFPESNPWKPSPIYGALTSVNRIIQDLQKNNPEFKSLVNGIVTTLGKRDV